MPGSFDWCRPDRNAFDEDTAALRAACVEGSLAGPHAGPRSETNIWHRKDLIANKCLATCDTLKQDPNANLRAPPTAFADCGDHFLCQSTLTGKNVDSYFR